MTTSPSPLRVYLVEIDSDPVAHLFNDLDTALSFIKAEITLNSAGRVVLTSKWRDYEEYVKGVEREDGGEGGTEEAA